jgi:hypothetical protein
MAVLSRWHPASFLQQPATTPGSGTQNIEADCHQRGTTSVETPQTPAPPIVSCGRFCWFFPGHTTPYPCDRHFNRARSDFHRQHAGSSPPHHLPASANATARDHQPELLQILPMTENLSSRPSVP